MDRRQRKTRTAIREAFWQLLLEKPYGKITVQDIIERADIGRSTFYAHFETKEELLRELSQDVFGSLISPSDALRIGEGIDSFYLSILQKLEKNAAGCRELLECENQDLFLDTLDGYLREAIGLRLPEDSLPGVPRSFLINHIAGSFLRLVRWYLSQNERPAPEEMETYFRAVMVIC